VVGRPAALPAPTEPPFPAALRAALAPLGELVEVKPDLENAFVAMTRGDRSSASCSAATRLAVGGRDADAVRVDHAPVRQVIAPEAAGGECAGKKSGRGEFFGWPNE